MYIESIELPKDTDKIVSDAVEGFLMAGSMHAVWLNVQDNFFLKIVSNYGTTLRLYKVDLTEDLLLVVSKIQDIINLEQQYIFQENKLKLRKVYVKNKKYTS